MPQQQEERQHVSYYLERKLSIVEANIKKLSKDDAKKNRQNIIDEFIDANLVGLPEVASNHDVSIDPDSPYVATVTWTFLRGDLNLFKYRVEHAAELNDIEGSVMRVEYKVPSPVYSSEAVMRGVLQRIEETKAGIQSFIEELQPIVRAYNGSLREQVPTWVKQRMIAVDGAINAETYLKG